MLLLVPQTPFKMTHLSGVIPPGFHPCPIFFPHGYTLPLADVRPHIFYLFITSMRITFDGSEDAITCQRARHGNAAARIAPFKSKCARHMVAKGSIHHLDYDEDVFTGIQTRSGLTKIMNSFVEFRFVF